jgi:1-acyl-sn-glycerol-3-phosphate acyltransferase
MRRILDALGLLRTLLFTLPLLYVINLVLGAVWLLVFPFDSRARAQDALARLWAASILLIGGTRMRVLGRENLERARACIFVANHASYLDIPILLAHLPRGVRFLAKASLFHVPFVGWYLRRTGHLPVRGGPRADARRLLQAVRYARAGHSLVVFPEGGRSLTGELQEFRHGVFLAALKSGVAIVPLTLVGTRRILPRYGWHWRPGRVTLVVGEPLETAGKRRDELAAVVDEVRRRIESNLREVEP